MQNKTVPELLADLLERKQLTRAAVIRAAGLARTYGYQLFDGTYTPTRDKLIQLAFGFQLTVEETQALLKAAGHAVLYTRTPVPRIDNVNFAALPDMQNVCCFNANKAKNCPFEGSFSPYFATSLLNDM